MDPSIRAESDQNGAHDERQEANPSKGLGLRGDSIFIQPGKYTPASLQDLTVLRWRVWLF
jgi:hypothetical protein